MHKKELTHFISGLDSRKEKKEIEQGTIWLKSYDEYAKVAEFFDHKLVKPFHAAKMLGVTKTQINRLEKEGTLRTYRMAFTDDVWKTVPGSLKLLITRSDVYIWIPLQDVEEYAARTGKDLKKVRSHYFNEFLG